MTQAEFDARVSTAAPKPEARKPIAFGKIMVGFVAVLLIGFKIFAHAAPIYKFGQRLMEPAACGLATTASRSNTGAINAPDCNTASKSTTTDGVRHL